MKSRDEKPESYSYTENKSEESSGSLMEVKMAELIKTKEELKRAKENAMQSWLDSRPLIDELETLKSGLATATNQCSLTTTVISELESELDTINVSIKSKKEQEHKATKMIDEINQALDELRDELERLKLDSDEDRIARSKLKQVLRLRRQTLRTLLLMLRAARIESEAYGASAAEALRQINHSEINNNTIQLTREEFNALIRKADEETSLADWRVSVSKEQKLAAEASRNNALMRLRESRFTNSSRRRRVEEKRYGDDGQGTRGADEQDSHAGVHDNNRGVTRPIARAEIIVDSDRVNLQQQRKFKSSNSRKLVKKKKTSIFHQIKSFFVRNISRLFG